MGRRRLRCCGGCAAVRLRFWPFLGAFVLLFCNAGSQNKQKTNNNNATLVNEGSKNKKKTKTNVGGKVGSPGRAHTITATRCLLGAAVRLPDSQTD